MTRAGKLTFIATVAGLTSLAMAQSNSLYRTGQPRGYASNVPPVSVTPLKVEVVREPSAQGPAAAADTAMQASDNAVLGGAGQSPSALANSPAAPQATVIGPPPADSGLAAAPPMPVPAPRMLPGQIRPYVPGATDACSPAVAALQQTSFIAVAPPAPRQFNVHDLVTIIVREESSYAADGESDLEKKYSFDAKLEKWLRLHDHKLVPELFPAFDGAPPQVKGSAHRKFEGDGTVNRKDTFVGRLTAEVVDVKPNGTLLLSARKHIQADNEHQWFELTGTCRVEDVNADNTVLSTQLANVAVCKKTAGQVRDSIRRGLIPWVADKAPLF